MTIILKQNELSKTSTIKIYYYVVINNKSKHIKFLHRMMKTLSIMQTIFLASNKLKYKENFLVNLSLYNFVSNKKLILIRFTINNKLTNKLIW